MAFVKITEQPSLYDNLEKKSVLEILQDINTAWKRLFGRSTVTNWRLTN